MVGNSLTSFEGGFWFNDVLVGASFAGAPTGAVPLRAGAKGWIAHEAGPGKDDSGVAGLTLADEFGMPAAAIATMDARLASGMSLMSGHLSRCNTAAARLGVKPGQTGEVAAHIMLENARSGRAIDLAGRIDEETHVVQTAAGNIYACWSFSRVTGIHNSDVFCVASHGARTMALYALRIKPKGLICNDAGRGMGDSGIEGLAELEKYGIAAAAVSADSARIGDALSTYYDGIISATNELAQNKGVRVGMRAEKAAELMLE